MYYLIIIQNATTKVHNELIKNKKIFLMENANTTFIRENTLQSENKINWILSVMEKIVIERKLKM